MRIRPVADPHLRSGLGAGEALQVTERRRLELAAVEAAGEPLEQPAETDPAIESFGEVVLCGPRLVVCGGRVALAQVPQPRHRAMLLDRSPERDDGEPGDRRLDRLLLEDGRVEALPRQCVGRLEIGPVEFDAAGPQARLDSGEDSAAQTLELLSHQSLGPVAT